MVAIRREDQSVWERRAPFAPHHVKKLVQSGLKMLVQPSNRRAYPMQVNRFGRCTNCLVDVSVFDFTSDKINFANLEL